MSGLQNAIALGTFDGLHAGHRAVLRSTLDYRPVAVTFRIPPRAVMTGTCGLLMTPEDKCRMLKQFGMAEICMLEFEQVRALPPTVFLEQLVERYRPALISCGYNYRFGAGAVGDTQLLARFCAEHGIGFHCCEPVSENGHGISSTAIRALLREGEIERANRHIYGGFGFTAPVLHGDERGRTVGFPTINQRYPELLTALRFGVYTARVCVDGREYGGIANIGVRPTWKTEQVMSETYLYGFTGDLYGRSVTVKLRRFLRDERKFSGLSDLRSTLTNDLERLKEELLLCENRMDSNV